MFYLLSLSEYTNVNFMHEFRNIYFYFTWLLVTRNSAVSRLTNIMFSEPLLFMYYLPAVKREREIFLVLDIALTSVPLVRSQKVKQTADKQVHQALLTLRAVVERQGCRGT